MSKIIEAFNVMIANREKISDVTKYARGEGYQFKYLGSQKWSVGKDDNGSIFVRFYPTQSRPKYDIGGDLTGGTLPASTSPNVSPLPSDQVDYRESDWTSPEAKATFRDLYETIRDMYYHIEDVLDEIIKNDATNRPGA